MSPLVEFVGFGGGFGFGSCWSLNASNTQVLDATHLKPAVLQVALSVLLRNPSRPPSKLQHSAKNCLQILPDFKSISGYVQLYSNQSLLRAQVEIKYRNRGAWEGAGSGAPAGPGAGPQRLLPRLRARDTADGLGDCLRPFKGLDAQPGAGIGSDDLAARQDRNRKRDGAIPKRFSRLAAKEFIWGRIQ